MRKRFYFCSLQQFFFLFFITMPSVLFATHQRAAEIVYRHISGLTYEITLISYTYTPSPANAYRDYLNINWGDGTSSDIPRVEKTNLANDITFNRYVGQHTYLGPSTYLISCEDPNRNGGILNIPNSINTPLFIYSELVINPFLGGYNNSPVLLLPPIDNGCVDQPFYHNPGAYDADGDSLSYRLVPCRGAQGLTIPGYELPNEIPNTNFSLPHSLTLDSITGDLIWDSPQLQGEYNIAILIEEWRNGVKIGSIERDMQIIVTACNNRPPVIENLNDTCIEAGHRLTFDVKAYDPDSTNLTLTGTGGPLVLQDHPAILFPNPATGHGHTKTTFIWQTICAHVKNPPYRVFFKAIDDGTPVKLVNIKSMQIRVVGPAPENLTATPLGSSITLNWDNYSCQNATGYYIYRKADSTGYVPGYCQTGVPPYLGYSRIDEIKDITKTSYLDNNLGSGLIPGIKYCYLIVAYYPDKAESYASNEACASLKRDVPVITNVSINTTNEVTGSIYVAWSKPTELDTLLAPGPYMYVVNRSLPGAPTQFVPVDSLYDMNDTLFTDTLIDTKNHFFRYKIDIYNLTPGNIFLIGSSQTATSIFLEIIPTDKRLILKWNDNVPWSNYRYVALRKEQGLAIFDSVGFSTVTSFIDQGLKNGTEYCYFIKSVGKYSSPGFVDPIVNFSQITCSVPVDNIPPCPPVLHESTDCIRAENILNWTNVYDSCSQDIIKYLIYYSSCNTGELRLIDSVTGINNTTYLHRPDFTIAGCYAVIAIDSAGNKSEFSNTVCVDISQCAIYEIPNIFTPNGDDYNPVLKPKPNFTSVDHIDMKIFDRWGREVFSTSDPEINWDGNDMTTGQMCSDGAYFYVCDVYENGLCGTAKRTLRGTVTILR
jgi:gliding motility-associated-like protein